MSAVRESEAGPGAVASVRSPLVGRTRELEAIQAALGRLRAGVPGSVAVAGDAGLGKTRLLRELTESVSPADEMVLAATAADFAQEVPFALITEALEGLARFAAPDTEAERYRCHHAARAHLEALASERPVLLILDDVHHADPASLELLVNLLRHPPDRPVLLVLAYRPRRLPIQLLGAVDAAAQRGRLDRLELGPLQAEHVDQLLGELDRPTMRWVLEQTGGNPLYVEELARAAVGPVPAAVHMSLAGELECVSAQARALAQAGAVLGELFDFAVAAEVAQLRDVDSTSALDELTASGLVRPTTEPWMFEFRQPLVRRTIYEATGAGWRLGAHARAARGLSARGHSELAVARHVDCSAGTGDVAAIDLLERAGRAAAPDAPHASVRWFRAALRLAPAGSPPHERLERRLAQDEEDHEPYAAPGLERAIMHFGVAEWEEAARWAAEVSGGAAERGDDGLRAAAEALLSRTALARVMVSAAREHCDRAAEVSDRLSDRDLATHLAGQVHVARAEAELGEFERAVMHGERALALARASGAAELIVPLGFSVGWSQDRLGLLDAARRTARAMLDAARLQADDDGLAPARILDARVAAHRGDVAYAVGEAEHAVALTRETPVDALAQMADCVLAEACIAAGQTERGRDHLIGRCGGPGLSLVEASCRASWLELLTEAELALDCHDGARAAVAAAEQVARRVDLPTEHAAARRAGARMLLAEGRPEASAHEAQVAMAVLERRSLRVEAARTATLLGRALALGGDSERAVAVLEAAHQELEGRGASRAASEAARELRRLGRVVPLRQRRAGSGAGLDLLSGREREVADLVACGNTNRQVAAALFVSERTVETHVSRIFRKLGVSSRSEVAREIGRAELSRDAG